MKAEKASQTDGHIGIPAEIGINHQGIQQYAQPSGGNVDPGVHPAENIVGGGRQNIRHQYFFASPMMKRSAPGGEILQSGFPAFQLAFHLVIFDDGALDQLREENDIQRHLHRVFIHLDLSVVDIQQIGYVVENDKRNPQRDQHIPYAEGRGGQLTEPPQGCIQVFVIEQRGYIENNADQQDLPEFQGQQADDIIEKDKPNQDADRVDVGPGEEYQRNADQPYILQQNFPARGEKTDQYVEKNRNRQKRETERWRN